jgi:hypothetical protein
MMNPRPRAIRTAPLTPVPTLQHADVHCGGKGEVVVGMMTVLPGMDTAMAPRSMTGLPLLQSRVPTAGDVEDQG